MITHERLKELIEQKATIYWLDYHDIIEVKHFETCGLKGVYCYEQVSYLYEEDAQEIKYLDRKWVSVEDLFETKEEANWEKEFKRISRTDYLDLPTWEELFDFDKATRFLDCYTQEFAITKKRSVIGVVLFGVDFTNKIIEVSIGSEKLFVEPLTKENYFEACRKAKELFLGQGEE